MEGRSKCIYMWLSIMQIGGKNDMNHPMGKGVYYASAMHSGSIE